jgi:restriction system protein
MLIIEIALAIVLLLAGGQLWLYKKRTEYTTSLIASQIDKSVKVKKTLAMGLYLRFKKEKEDEKTSYSKLFIKEDPISFESFVASIYEASKGGITFVTPPTHDFGVDFEHELKDGLYLGQVKCHKDDLCYEPIAILHSNMVKRNAKGGYVVTTGSFTKNALEYAASLNNIELIDGVKLVEIWMESLEATESSINLVTN